ncbi:8893_t:CDS:2 [Funneliformis geosporum]|uniref:8893_t:CDS:1 n=1 Tax=Funneliformis geosporum TaxID=1117311 RepID=A0A9W4SNZ3_9GLOM|nr:8893_t:CDS:2 [Funneliformis geosporum]
MYQECYYTSPHKTSHVTDTEALKKTKIVAVKKELHSNEDAKELEKVLYSKECVAQCINFVVSEASKEDTTLNVQERFSYNLATILAREKEVVAVRLKVLPGRCEIYLAKNFAWSKSDSNYIAEIENYLKEMSKSAPKILSNTENAFTRAVSSYCFAKLETRLDKLKSDIKNDNGHVKSFRDFFSTKVDDADKDNMYIISRVCNEYYKIVKDDNNIPPKFLGHIKKVGSYAGSMIGIIECARNIQYKLLFSNVKVYTKGPVIDNQHIYSWKDITKRFIDEDDKDTYKRFMDNCSKKPKNKIKHYTSSLPADSDSGGNSPNLKSSDGKYLDEYFKQNTIKKYTLL